MPLFSIFPESARVNERKLNSRKCNTIPLHFFDKGCGSLFGVVGRWVGWLNITKIVIDTKFMMCSGCEKQPPTQERETKGVTIGGCGEVGAAVSFQMPKQLSYCRESGIVIPFKTKTRARKRVGCALFGGCYTVA